MKQYTTWPCAGLLLSIACLAGAHAQTVTWDGGAADGLWSSASNWDGDTVPAAGDDVFISNGDSVTGIEFNTTFDLTLSGGSSLTDPVTNVAGGVWRAGGATVTVNSGSTLGSGGWWDFQNATLTFKDGAVVNMSNWEQKDTNVFNFELSAGGFTTLTPGSFRIGNGSLTADIANATYNVDMAAYTGPVDAVITLADFGGDAFGMDNATFQGAGGLNVLNPGSYTASLRWNDANEAIELVVGLGLAWDGTAADGLWSTATNWSNDMLPAAGSEVNIANGDTVDWNSAVSGQFLPNGITVNLLNNSTLTEPGTIRLNGATINVASGSTLAGGFWDMLNGTLSFEDGAVASMSNWEQSGTNAFNFELGAAGFTALTPGTFRIFAASTIADATYNVDMANYTGGAAVITLVDFGGDAAGMDDAVFQGAGGLNVLNVPSGLSATLQWNDTTEAIELNVTAAVGVPNIIDITLDGSGNVVLTLDGSAAGLTAQRSNGLTDGSFTDVASTPGTNTLTIDAVNVDPNGDGADYYRVRN